MEMMIFTTLLFVTVSAYLQFGKHVYIETDLPWREAMTFCKEHFTDLSPITSSNEKWLKNVTAGKITDTFWTGLYWNRTHWKWSGGFTDNIPPSVADRSYDGPYSAGLCLDCSDRWQLKDLKSDMPFLCINLVVIEMKESWEEALESCRQNHNSLISISTRTELMLATDMIQQDHITDRVWIGLRFLRNRWLWVNNDPLVYQAWDKASQDQQCPVEGHCGALNKQGLWENWDCQEKLNFICY